MPAYVISPWSSDAIYTLTWAADSAYTLAGWTSETY